MLRVPDRVGIMLIRPCRCRTNARLPKGNCQRCFESECKFSVSCIFFFIYFFAQMEYTRVSSFALAFVRVCAFSWSLASLVHSNCQYYFHKCNQICSETHESERILRDDTRQRTHTCKTRWKQTKATTNNVWLSLLILALYERGAVRMLPLYTMYNFFGHFSFFFFLFLFGLFLRGGNYLFDSDGGERKCAWPRDRHIHCICAKSAASQRMPRGNECKKKSARYLFILCLGISRRRRRRRRHRQARQCAFTIWACPNQCAIYLWRDTIFEKRIHASRARPSCAVQRYTH